MNPEMIRTMISNSLRQELSNDANLGAGNFLSAALKSSPFPDDPILYCEVPFKSFLGESYSELSLTDLDSLSHQYAGWYWKMGVRAHDPVAIYRDDGVAYLIHYLALVKIGAIGVLTNGNMAPEIAAIHFERVGVIGGFLDRAHLNEIRKHISGEKLKFLVCDEDIEGSAPTLLPAEALHRHSPDDPIMIAHSSGTTGIPKAVLLQHEKFFYGVRYRLKMPAVRGGERILSSLPHSHNCAIAYIMLALLSGTPVFVTSDHSGENALRQIEKYKATMVVSFPQTYVEITECKMDAYDLRSVALWFNGGDAAHEIHIKQLIRYGTHYRGETPVQGSIFIDGMGSSEMGFSLFRHIHHPGSQHYNRCVGKPLEWVDAQIIGAKGELLPPREIGRLGVKAPSVTSGYWNNSALTYKSRVQGYWLTGDLAYRDEDGFFYHVDRTPDLVETPRGPVYTLETEELLMRENACVSDVSVVAVASPNGKKEAQAFVRLRAHDARSGDATSSEAILEKTNRVLKKAGRTPISAVKFVSVHDIPLGTTGKVLKRILRDRFEGRTHASV